MQPRLTVITLGVKNIAASLVFYRDALGWPVVGGDGEDIYFFQLNSLVFALYPREKLAEDIQISSNGSGFSGFSLAHNVASEDEVNDVLKTVERAGARILKPAQQVFWGGYSGYFADPDGFAWEVAYNPFWQLSEEGKVILPKE